MGKNTLWRLLGIALRICPMWMNIVRLPLG